MTTAINITEAMLSLIAEQPRKGIDLADMLGCTTGAINNRLRRLEAIRQVHHTRLVGKTGISYRWHIGPAGSYIAPLPLQPTPGAEIEEDAPGAGQPIRNIVSTWKPVLIRNEFETYFHGPAQGRAQP